MEEKMEEEKTFGRQEETRRKKMLPGKNRSENRMKTRENPEKKIVKT